MKELKNEKIKFRAWHKEEKQMGFVHQISWHYGCGVEISTLGYWHDNGEKYELMQYTGLKDKRGKDVYEGDIVILDKFYPQPHIVVFHIGCFVLYNVYEKQIYDLHYIENCGSIDAMIIGNIYENHKLIE